MLQCIYPSIKNEDILNFGMDIERVKLLTLEQVDKKAGKQQSEIFAENAQSTAHILKERAIIF
jgi:hypothetical protein